MNADDSRIAIFTTRSREKIPVPVQVRMIHGLVVMARVKGPGPYLTASECRRPALFRCG